MSSPQRFRATHVILVESPGLTGTEAIPVMLTDLGAAYTEVEWDTFQCADWEVFEGQWLFQGEAPAIDQTVTIIPVPR